MTGYRRVTGVAICQGMVASGIGIALAFAGWRKLSKHFRHHHAVLDHLAYPSTLKLFDSNRKIGYF